MTLSTLIGPAALEHDVSPENDRSFSAWALVALVPLAILASTVTSLAAMG